MADQSDAMKQFNSQVRPDPRGGPRATTTLDPLIAPRPPFQSAHRAFSSVFSARRTLCLRAHTSEETHRLTARFLHSLPLRRSGDVRGDDPEAKHLTQTICSASRYPALGADRHGDVRPARRRGVLQGPGDPVKEPKGDIMTTLENTVKAATTEIESCKQREGTAEAGGTEATSRSSCRAASALA